MGELANGASSIVTATINGATIFFPGQVQWGGTYLLVGDQEFNVQPESGLYQMSISGSTLTAHGSFLFAGAQDVLGFYKRGSVPNASVVAPDSELGDANVYDFPAGGTLSSFLLSGRTERRSRKRPSANPPFHNGVVLCTFARGTTV